MSHSSLWSGADWSGGGNPFWDSAGGSVEAVSSWPPVAWGNMIFVSLFAISCSTYQYPIDIFEISFFYININWWVLQGHHLLTIWLPVACCLGVFNTFVTCQKSLFQYTNINILLIFLRFLTPNLKHQLVGRSRPQSPHNLAP